MKRLLTIILSTAMIFTALPWSAVSASAAEPEIELMAETQVFDGGTGTEEDPYLISTAEQLRLIQDFPSCSYRLLNDIELTSWNYIGYAGDDFSGVFDGDYHTISGLTQRFVDENNGTIKNTNFLDGKSWVASKNNGTIENCTAEANVSEYYGYDKTYVKYNNSFSYYAYDYYYAGFVAYNYGTVRNCAFRGSVKGSASPEDYYVSGFIGHNYGTIENCYADATVSGEYVYGFINSNRTDSVIINSYSRSTLSSGSSDKCGFCSTNSGTITNCYYDKDAAGTASTTHGTPKATLAMKMQNTYTDWDFDSVWAIDENVNDGYPYLRMENNEPSGVKDIIFSKQYIYVRPGDEKQLYAELLPEDTGHKKVWTSSDDKIATVSPTGVVTGVKAGDAEITLTVGECSKSCMVHVVDDLISVNGMSLDRSSLALDKGGEYTLTAALDPANATDKGVSWSSSDPAVASVDAEGKVTAVADGTAVITAVTNDGDFKAECSVSVRTPVKDIKISKTSLDMYVGKVETLTAEISPSDATNKNVVWTSSDSDIASVADGIVTAKKAGTATITVTTDDGGLYAQCAVTVTVPVDGITLNRTSAEIALGDSIELIPTIDPANASDQRVIWSTTDKEVVTVDNGVVKAVGTGMATVTATTADGSKTASCRITVPVAVTGITLDETSITINRGRTKQLNAVIEPSDATNKNIIWKSSDERIAKVENGIVTGISEGTALITATTSDGEKSAQCTVRVNVAVEGITLDRSTVTLPLGKMTELIPTITPSDATDQTVTWTSSAPGIVKVENGIVTAVGTGTATITAATADGNYKAACVVNVPVSVTGITLNRSDITLVKNGTYTLRATVSPVNATNKKVIWRSSDDDIVTVKDGLITAVSAGSAVVTALSEDGSYSADCKVTVTVNSDGITLSESDITMRINEVTSITATVLPLDSTDKTVTWSSSNEKVATVDNGTITALTSGTTVIRAVSANGNSAECVVTVIVPVDGITLDASAIKLNAGDSRTLIPTITPANAGIKDIIWTSSDDGIATVDNGTVTAVDAGTAVIAAKTVDGNKIASCEVTVVIPATEVVLNKTISVLEQGDTDTLTANVLPLNATDRNVIWTSSDDNIVSVDNGIITAKEPGSAVITARCGNVSAVCVVNVGVKYSANIEVGSVRDRAGETVTLPVSISNNPGIAAFSLTVNYDSSKLTPVSIEKGEALGDSGELTSNLQEGALDGDAVTAYWVDPENFTGNGEMLLVTFTINEGTEDGEVPVEISYTLGDVTNQEYESVALNITNGAVNVASVIPGDVYEDGDVNVKDGLKLSQYLAEWDVPMSEFETLAADIYKDDEINAKDGLKLSQYLAGWNVSLVSLLDTGNIGFEVGSAEAAPGGYVDVPVVITENTGVATFNLKISYDSALTPVSITSNLMEGSLTSNLQQGIVDAGYVTAYWVNPSDITATGNAFTIRFKVSEDAEGELPVTISCSDGDICDQSFGNIDASFSDGLVTIKDGAGNGDLAYTVNSIEVESISDGHAYARINVTKNIESKADDTLIIASYDEEGRLVDLTTMQAQYLNGQNVTFRGRIVYGEGYSVKAFVWDDIDSMNVLSNAVTFE